MSFNDPMVVTFLVGIGLATAGFAVFLSNWLTQRSAGPMHMVLQPYDAPRSYAFRDGYLLSEVDEDDAFLSDPGDRVGAWAELVRALSTLNSEAESKMTALRDRGEAFVLIGRIGQDSLSISGRMAEDRSVVTVAGLDGSRARRSVDQAGLDAMEHEMSVLREAMDNCHTVMWRQTPEGQITWANSAYYTLLKRLSGDESALVWPIRAIFAEYTVPPPEPGRLRRCSLETPDQEDPLWYDINAVESGAERLFAARSIDRLVSAEASLRDFVQTLSRTFAHLPIGLAIFDKKRELVLFNPALVSLSTLDPQWLSSRPGLFAFLDNLREHQRMPEPKDYQSWRASLAELEQAARDGTYQELWTLPTGQTFRVIGRPHADGAVAFMFEDISAEVSLTRRFRGDLELFQSVLDDSSEAIAVFSAEGQIVASNAAYAALWDYDPQAQLGQAGLLDACRIWQQSCKPTPIWGEVRDFVQGASERSAWHERIVLRDDSELECRMSPLKAGASLVGFSPVAGVTPLTAPRPLDEVAETEFG